MRSVGKPFSAAICSTKLRKSFGVMPVYPPSWLTWLHVASISSGSCVGSVARIDASSTMGCAEQTEGMPDGPARSSHVAMSRSGFWVM